MKMLKLEVFESLDYTESDFWNDEAIRETDRTIWNSNVMMNFAAKRVLSVSTGDSKKGSEIENRWMDDWKEYFWAEALN